MMSVVVCTLNDLSCCVIKLRIVEKFNNWLWTGEIIQLYKVELLYIFKANSNRKAESLMLYKYQFMFHIFDSLFRNACDYLLYSSVGIAILYSKKIGLPPKTSFIDGSISSTTYFEIMRKKLLCHLFSCV